MLAKTITWTDFEDQQQTKTFYFHLSKAEGIRLVMTTGQDSEAGLNAWIAEVVKTRDSEKMFELMAALVQNSVGIKDGNRFIKNKVIVDEFVQTGAYDELLIELVTNDESAAAFANGVLPKDVREGNPTVNGVKFDMPLPEPIKPKVPLSDLSKMSKQDFEDLQKMQNS